MITFPLVIDEETWRKFRLKCLNERKTAKLALRELVEQAVAKSEKSKKEPGLYDKA